MQYTHDYYFALVEVVMLTTSMDPKDKERAEQYEVIKDYFQKPLTGDLFEALIDSFSVQSPAKGA